MLALGSKYFLPLETISYFKTIRKNSSLVYERRAERRRGIMEFFFFFLINIHIWKYFIEHSSRELNEFEQKDQLWMELSKFR